MSSIYFLSTLDMFKKDIDYAHLISSGREKYGENKYEDSIEDFTKAIKKIPNFIDAYIWRGMANFKFKKYADSIEDFNKSIDRIPTIESNPFSFLAYFHRGNVKFALKDYQGAMVDFNKATEFKEVYTTYFDNEFIDRTYNIHAGAKSKINDFTDELRQGHTAIKWSGYAKFELKDYQGAIKDFNRYIDLEPNDSYALTWRGVIKFALKDYQGAIHDLTKGIESLRKKADLLNTYMLLGAAKFQLKDYQGAIDDYTKAIEINPNDQIALKYLDKCKNNFKK